MACSAAALLPTRLVPMQISRITIEAYDECNTIIGVAGAIRRNRAAAGRIGVVGGVGSFLASGKARLQLPGRFA